MEAVSKKAKYQRKQIFFMYRYVGAAPINFLVFLKYISLTVHFCVVIHFHVVRM